MDNEDELSKLREHLAAQKAVLQELTKHCDPYVSSMAGAALDGPEAVRKKLDSIAKPSTTPQKVSGADSKESMYKHPVPDSCISF